MSVLRLVAQRLLVGVMVFGANVLYGEDYPNKAIRIITSTPGGSSDLVTRLIAPGLTDTFGQPVIADNRAGILTAEIAAKAAPDGYTLLLHDKTVWIVPLLQKTAYDPVRDFSPITLTTSQPSILAVHPSLQVKSVKELIALAKAKPGALNYAYAVSGSASHLAGELFKGMAGVNMVSVPYKGGGPAVTDLISGQVQMMFIGAATAAPHLKSGRLSFLAVTSAQPSALYPDLPTVAASGLPGFEAGNTNAVFAPAKTPAAIIKRLNEATIRLLNRPDTRSKILDAGLDVVGSSPDQLAAVMKAEIARIGKVIRDAGIRVE